MRINELKNIISLIDQKIALHGMTFRMGRLGRYAMLKDDVSGLGYDITLELSSLSVTYFKAKDDIYKTKYEVHQLTPKQYFIIKDWLEAMIIKV